jgi:hypothetical protein
MSHIYNSVKELKAITALIMPYTGMLGCLVQYTDWATYEAQELEILMQNISAGIHGGIYRHFYHSHWKTHKFQDLHDRVEFICKNLRDHGHLIRQTSEWPEIAHDLFIAEMNLFRAKGTRIGKLSELYDRLSGAISMIHTDNLSTQDIEFARDIIARAMQNAHFVPDYTTEFKKNISHVCQLYRLARLFDAIWRYPGILNKMQDLQQVITRR